MGHRSVLGGGGCDFQRLVKKQSFKNYNGNAGSNSIMKEVDFDL